MRIWMEEQAGERDHFAAKITLSLVGLVAAVIALPCGIVLLALILDWPVAEVSMAACLGGVALALFSQGRSGGRFINTARSSARTMREDSLQWISGNLWDTRGACPGLSRCSFRCRRQRPI